MKKNKLPYTIILICILIGFAGIYIYAGLTPSEVDFTTNIENYGSGKYRLDSDIFLNEIPENAEVVNFTYYKYWHEEQDIYLELKFHSKEEMDSYLSNIRETCIKAQQNHSNNTKDRNWFITEQNPYDPSYTDSFFIAHYSNIAGRDFTGYHMEGKGLCFYHFAVISFSYEELTTIQTYACGAFVENAKRYTPRYFIRFQVPMDVTMNRVHYLD